MYFANILGRSIIPTRALASQRSHGPPSPLPHTHYTHLLASSRAIICHARPILFLHQTSKRIWKEINLWAWHYIIYKIYITRVGMHWILSALILPDWRRKTMYVSRHTSNAPIHPNPTKQHFFLPLAFVILAIQCIYILHAYSTRNSEFSVSQYFSMERWIRQCMRGNDFFFPTPNIDDCLRMKRNLRLRLFV